MYQTIISLMTMLILSCGGSKEISKNAEATQIKQSKNLDNYKRAYFASGCFWCVEAVYESVKGVAESISGYSGGHTKNPSYESSNTGRTGHAEAVEIYYDPEVVDFETLVKVYYASQDPTQVNGQGPDRGSQYRSIIFYQNDIEKSIAETWKKKIAAQYDQPIATEILPFVRFWKAEDYHQDYERLHPNHPYIKSISIPRLRAFQQKHPELLKDHDAH